MDGPSVCPTCGSPVAPGGRSCPRCGATIADPDWDALDSLRGRIVAVDTQVSDLLSQRQSLVDQYERHRLAIYNRALPGVPLAPVPVPGHAPARQEWSGARVRALTLGLGATLLGISALTFTAVAWSRLGDGGRAVLLLLATAVITGLALALRRRLPMTAEAFAGLAIMLVLVDLYAVRRAGVVPDMPWQLWWAFGLAAAAGFAAALGRVAGRRTTGFAIAALLPVVAQLMADWVGRREWAAALILAGLAALIPILKARWARQLFPESRVVLTLHTIGSWLAAAVLAGIAAWQAKSPAGAVLPALAVGALAAAPELARRRLADPVLRTGAAALAAGVPVGMLLTLMSPLTGPDVLQTVAVVGGGATVLAAALLAGAGHRKGGLVAGTAFAVPGALWAVGVSVPAVIGPLAWLAEPWGGTVHAIARDVYTGPHAAATLDASWTAVTCLGVIAAVGIGLGYRLPWFFGIASAAMGLVAALMPVIAGATVLVTLAATTAVLVLLLLAGAWTDRMRVGSGWALLPGAGVVAVPTAGWAAVSPAASVSALGVTTLAAGAAAALCVTRAARSLHAGLAALLLAAFAGVATRAAGAALPAAGFAVAVTAGVIVLVGVHALRGDPPTGIALECAGAATALAGVLSAADSRTWLAGALTALVPLAAAGALRAERRVLYGTVAGVLALGAVWAWLAVAEVDLTEAYTAPAAAIALAAGIIQWRTGPGRSWITLGPALLLAIGPTLVLGMVDDDAVRLVVAALLGLAAVIVGGVLRLQAPLCLGAVALLLLAIDQWGDDIVRMPRWITLGVVGVLLMWIGATFERRRRDWRRTTEVVGRFG